MLKVRNPLLSTSRTLFPFALLGLLLSLGACTVGPDYRTPTASLPDRIAPLTGIPSASTSLVDSQWWAAFQDPLLDQLQSAATTNNLDLVRASARLREARALWNEARFDYAPTITAEAQYLNTQSSVAAAPPTLSRDQRHIELYRGGFDATWELDLFGRVRRNVEATRATVEAVSATRDDVLISVRAEVAANYVALRGLQAQLAAARDSAANQAASLKLAETLRDGGRGTQLDVARAESQLNGTLATIPPFEAAIDRTIHRLGVLAGQPPRHFFNQLSPAQVVPIVPSLPIPPEPAELLRRRPDIRAAEQSLAADTARIGVQVADLFPRVTVQGRIGLEASRLSGLDNSGTDVWGFGPTISWAAFDLGRVRQRIRAANARAEGTLATYQQTVLLALEETENALRTYERQVQRLALLGKAVSAASEAATLARQRYEDGVADFLAVLDAERVQLLQQVELAGAQANAATAAIAIYKTFGGGWAIPD
jgi:multidrug efflux system outer membrane protein